MEKKTNPIKAIRAHCLECCGTSHEVELCHAPDCQLYDFRFGKNPFRQKKKLTEEQKKAASERFAAYRANKAGVND